MWVSNDKIERLIVIEYEEATITEEDRASTKVQDIRRCLKAGVLPKCYEHTIMDIEVQQQNQISCFTRSPDDTVVCPMGYLLTRVRTLKDGSARYQNRLACGECPNRCTPSKTYKVVKFGPNTCYVPILMYGTALQQLQVYPASEKPYNAFRQLERQARMKVVLHIRDDIPTQKLRL